MHVTALIVAAGSGSRMGDGPPKQYRRIGGKPVSCIVIRSQSHC